MSFERSQFGPVIFLSPFIEQRIKRAAEQFADGSYDRILKFTETGTPTPTPTPTPTAKPSVSLRAAPKSVKAGHSVTISGAGAFQWTKKMTKPGKWTLVATYKVGTVTYASKAVTVTVRK